MQIREVILRWKERTNKGVLALSFTAFCPHAATPLATAPINDEYWKHFVDFKNWFFAGRGWSNRIKIMSPQQPANRMAKAMATMGLSEAQLREGGRWGPNDRVDYPYKAQARQIEKNLRGGVIHAL